MYNPTYEARYQAPDGRPDTPFELHGRRQRANVYWYGKYQKLQKNIMQEQSARATFKDFNFGALYGGWMNAGAAPNYAEQAAQVDLEVMKENRLVKQLRQDLANAHGLTTKYAGENSQLRVEHKRLKDGFKFLNQRLANQKQTIIDYQQKVEKFKGDIEQMVQDRSRRELTIRDLQIKLQATDQVPDPPYELVNLTDSS